MNTFIIISSMLLLFLSSTGCGQKMKFDFDKLGNNPIETRKYKSDPSQTVDSIFVFDTGRIITTTGKHIYEITTLAEKRMADSLYEMAKKEKFSNPFAPSATFQPYSFSDRTLFSIIMYDSLGYEYSKLLERELLPGEYCVKFAIYSVLSPGLYFMETRFQNQRELIKLIIN